VGARRAYGRIVRRKPHRVTPILGEGAPWEKPPRLLHPGHRRGSHTAGRKHPTGE
jgi:hypothetical protein